MAKLHDKKKAMAKKMRQKGKGSLEIVKGRGGISNEGNNLYEAKNEQERQ